MEKVRDLRFVLLLMACLAASASAGTFVPLGATAGTGEIVAVRATDQADDVIQIEYTLEGFELSPVEINGATYHAVKVGDEGRRLEAGMPELPHIARSVIIPDDAEMEVRLVASSYKEFANIDVIPSKGNLLRSIDPESVPYEFGEVYQGDAFFPESIASARAPYILRDYRGLTVLVSPVQYNPATHTLRVYDHIVVEVVPVGPGVTNVLYRDSSPAATPAAFAQLYDDHFINMGTRYQPIDEIGELLIIAYDNFAANMEPLVAWKNAMGIQTTLVTKSEVGSTYQQFQTYIQNYYDDPETDLAFVLLIGDAAQIPSPSNGGAPADPVYALVDGADSYPDIFVGRLSAETADQVDLQVQKFIEYEQTPQAGAHWYHRGVGIGSGEGAGIGDDGEADWEHIENIRTDLLAFTYTGVDSVYAHSPWQANATMVANAVNDGRTIINYCGHGSMTAWSTTGFSNTHVNALTNDNKLPWIISVACVNGKFHTGTCFAEAWLRATHNGEPTGAVGMYASTVNMSWAPPMAAQDESVDLLVAESKRTFGALCYSGSCQMMDEYGTGGISEFKNWHIFGDPSLRVMSSTPADLTVQHDDSIDPGATTFTVTVPGIYGAMCGLSKDGAFLGSALTNVSGVAEIEIAGALPNDSVRLTVTSFNAMPYTADLAVGSPLIPSLGTNPAEFEVWVDLEETWTEHLYISNTGMEGSVLEFSLTAMPTGVNPWISVSPRTGEVPYGEMADITVNFDTHGLTLGDYAGRIVIASNGGRGLVPVMLHAGDYTAVDDEPQARIFALAPASPNPFSGLTSIEFSLPEAGAARLGVYDMSGRLVRTLVSGTVSAGSHRIGWDGRDEEGALLPGGVYLYRLENGRDNLNRKVMMLR